MRSMVIALVVSAALALPGAAAAKSYGGDYSTKSKCEKAMQKEQKAYRKTHGKHAALFLRCKHRHGRYWLVRA
jgi:formate dehydrogenase assembly factor FdhD